jgi:hypothetical protein
MHTNWELNQAQTRSIAIDATPSSVHEFMSAPGNIPRWAPKFATEVHRDGERWIATSARGDAEIVVDSHPSARTVDILSAADRTRGAFARVLPNGSGCEVLFTLFFAADASAEAIATQMTIVDEELAAISHHVG